MAAFIIIGELRKAISGDYEIAFSGAFRDQQIKKVYLLFDIKYISLLKENVVVEVYRDHLKNKTVYCTEYKIRKIF